MAVVAIITARGGSKRIPRKNIRDFMGKPMIAYAIEAAKGSGIFDEVMVSTDDEEIADVAQIYGASVPFVRSKKNSDDFATTSDVLEEVLQGYLEKGISWDSFCCIYPCVPFLKADTLTAAYRKFHTSQADSLVPVVRYSYPIQRAFVEQNGYLRYREEGNERVRSQDLDPTYHDVGMFYFSRTKPFLHSQSLVMSKTVLYELDELQVQDIDTLDDWKLAEFKYSYLNRKE